jgi:hypothetical protein
MICRKFTVTFLQDANMVTIVLTNSKECYVRRTTPRLIGGSTGCPYHALAGLDIRPGTGRWISFGGEHKLLSTGKTKEL